MRIDSVCFYVKIYKITAQYAFIVMPDLIRHPEKIL